MKNVTPSSDTTTAFLREVDEAIQQERLMAVWHQTKWFLLAALIALVLAIAGKEAWQAWSMHKARTHAAQWFAFTELKTEAEREKILPEILADTSGGTRALALYAKATMQHEPKAKAEAYLALADDASEPQWLRDVARLNAAIALMDNNAASAKAQLEMLAQTPYDDLPSPAYGPALELLALLSQQAGDTNAARGYTLKLLQVANLPADMRQRALQRAGVLGGAPVQGSVLMPAK